MIQVILNEVSTTLCDSCFRVIPLGMLVVQLEHLACRNTLPLHVCTQCFRQTADVLSTRQGLNGTTADTGETR